MFWLMLRSLRVLLSLLSCLDNREGLNVGTDGDEWDRELCFYMCSLTLKFGNTL